MSVSIILRTLGIAFALALCQLVAAAPAPQVEPSCYSTLTIYGPCNTVLPTGPGAPPRLPITGRQVPTLDPLRCVAIVCAETATASSTSPPLTAPTDPPPSSGAESLGPVPTPPPVGAPTISYTPSESSEPPDLLPSPYTGPVPPLSGAYSTISYTPSESSEPPDLLPPGVGAATSTIAPDAASTTAAPSTLITSTVGDSSTSTMRTRPGPCTTTGCLQFLSGATVAGISGPTQDSAASSTVDYAAAFLTAAPSSLTTSTVADSSTSTSSTQGRCPDPPCSTLAFPSGATSEPIGIVKRRPGKIQLF